MIKVVALANARELNAIVSHGEAEVGDLHPQRKADDG